jgi:hypothetical protein
MALQGNPGVRIKGGDRHGVRSPTIPAIV